MVGIHESKGGEDGNEILSKANTQAITPHRVEEEEREVTSARGGLILLFLNHHPLQFAYTPFPILLLILNPLFSHQKKMFRLIRLVANLCRNITRPYSFGYFRVEIRKI